MGVCLEIWEMKIPEPIEPDLLKYRSVNYQWFMKMLKKDFYVPFYKYFQGIE